MSILENSLHGLNILNLLQRVKLEEKREEQGVNISELYKIVGELKEHQHELKEIYNNRPITPDPSEKQGEDPLTPTDQKFATLKDLAANYRLFVNRVEQQLYTIGGGGAGFIKDLSDVSIGASPVSYTHLTLPTNREV